MASRPKFWPRPRPQSASASASNIWPRLGLDLVVLLCNRAFLGKNSVKFEILLTFSAIILNRTLLCLVLFHNYFWPRLWPQPPEIGLGLEVLASFNITVAK